ncbi:MAG: hypothetical protein Q4G68_00915 [Planctomycetia bacterium]|nr:hypothetical protein [Planctomycetia bacterium]
MTRRRTGAPASSLELFLDTICNTFGGILFILLFVVLLLKMTQPPERALSEGTPSASELAQLTADLDSARQDWQTVQEEQQALDETTQKLLISDAVDLYRQLVALKQDIDELVRQTTTVEREATRLEDEIASSAQRLEQKKLELTQLESEVQKSEKRLEQEETKLSRTKSESVESQSLPQLRPSYKNEVALVLRYHRLYLWHKYSSTGERYGLNTEDFTILEREGMVATTTPKPWRGIDLSSPEVARPKITAVMQRFSKEAVTMAIVCGDDSFDDYRLVRNVAKGLGFDIHPIPFTTESRVVDQGGSGQAQ